MRSRSFVLALAPLIVALSCSPDATTGPDSAHSLKVSPPRSIITTEIDGYTVSEFFDYGGYASYGITGNGDLVGSLVIGDPNYIPESPAFFPADGSSPTQFDCCGDATAANEFGDFVSGTYGGSAFIYYFSDHTPRALPTGGKFAWPNAISIARDVVGYMWVTPTMRHAVDWPAGTNAVDLGSLGTNSWANAVNKLGDVVGVSETAAGNRATIWIHAGSPRELPSPYGGSCGATGINDTRDVVGYCQAADGNHAVIWPAAGSAMELGTLGGNSLAYAINNARTVVGASVVDGHLMATVWTAIGSPHALPKGQDDEAIAINQAGQIVGRRGIRWAVAPIRFPPPFTGNIAPQVAAGSAHSCSLSTESKITCWGSNFAGETTVPASLGRVMQLGAGGNNTCVTQTDWRAVCWGAAFSGAQSVPKDLGPISWIGASFSFICALKTDGTVRCWGNNDFGQLNVPAGLKSVTQLSVGDWNACAVTGGKVSCWGRNLSHSAEVPPGLSGVVQVTAGNSHTCALLTDGTVTCWGSNTSGQSTIPTNLGNVAEVRAGSVHTCARTNDFAVICWGSNANFQTAIPDGVSGAAIQISTNNLHTCAVLRDGTVQCWGGVSPAPRTVPAGLRLIVDLTPPTITYTRTPTANGFGWNNTDVQISFATNDAESGVASSAGCDPVNVTQEGANLRVACTATNWVGLVNSAEVFVNIDKTAPTIVVPANVSVDATGTTGANVTYSVNATDALSGVQSVECTVPSGSLFPIGTTSVFCTATDRAGNPAVASFDVIVRSAAQQTQNLIDEVSNDPNLKSSLANTLNKALSNPATACKNLDKFIDTVQKSAGKQIPADQAAQLIQSAMNTKATMGCP